MNKLPNGARPGEPGQDMAAWLTDLSGRVLPALLDSLATMPADRPEPGDRVGAYHLLSVLGEGGMGIVFRARDERLDREVAVKFLHQSERSDATRGRLLDEARAAARLDHPGIAVVHEVSETPEGRAFIVMACHDGETLAARVADGPLSVDGAVRIARHLADALAAAHRAGVVHGDVKPSNIVLAPGGGIRLVDFGLASRSTDAADELRHGMGTLPYMSPEQVERRAIDARSDVWAAGVTLYEMLAGTRPFTGQTPKDVLNAIRTAEPVPLHGRRPDVPAALSSIVSRCLAKQPGERFGSAKELFDALTAVVADWPGEVAARPADGGETSAAAARYREGRLLLDGGDPRSAGRARDAFLEALRIQPDHALAWSGLSDAYELMAYLAMLPPEEAHLRARAAAERALEIEPDLPEALVSLATVLVDYYRDWSRAGELYRRALALKPEYAIGRQLYAEYLRDLGRFDEAIEEIDEAIRLDPLSPFFRMVRGIVLHMARRPAESIAAFEQLLAATPNYAIAHFFIALPLAASRQFDRALDALARVDPDGTFPDAIGIRGGILGRMGRRAEAEAAIQALQRIGSGHYVLPFHEAGIRIGLREFEKAIELLEQDADRRSWFSRLLGVEPGLDELRASPRFHALLARAGPPPELRLVANETATDGQ